MRRVARRIGQGLITIVLVILVNFALLHLAPGDAADVLAGEQGSSDPAMMAALRQQLGLDQPLPVQFLIYLGRLARFDLGRSLHTNETVLQLIGERLPATLLLMLPSLAVAFMAGIALGVAAARRVNSWVDVAISVFALIAYATPLFWLGLMLIILFTLELGWLPSAGVATIGAAFSPWQAVRDVLAHLVLPVATLSLFYIATYARLMRASMLEVAGADFVRAARAKGLREWRVTWGHVVRNALLPVVTMLGLHVGALLGGAVVVEVVFSWPGLGLLAFDAVFQRDNTLLLGLLFFCSCLVIVVNICVDLLYAWLDPRVVVAGRRG
jgi:peptide/nickel transport system permease protein